MIEYIPKTKKKQTTTLCIGLIILGMIVIAFAGSALFKDLLGKYAWVLQVAALFPVVVGFVFAEKYLFTEYVYQIYDESDKMSAYPKLYINCVQGKKAKPESCCLTFDAMISIDKKEKDTVVKERCSTFVANIRPKESYIIKYTDGEEALALQIECDEAFASEIDSRIKTWGCHLNDDGDENEKEDLL